MPNYIVIKVATGGRNEFIGKSIIKFTEDWSRNATRTQKVGGFFGLKMSRYRLWGWRVGEC